MTLHLNRSALERIVADRTPEAAKALGNQIATQVRRQRITVGDVDGGPNEYPLPVRVSEIDGFTRVALAHPAGKAVQSKHGALTRAAAALGLEVRS